MTHPVLTKLIPVTAGEALTELQRKYTLDDLALNPELNKLYRAIQELESFDSCSVLNNNILQLLNKYL